MIDFDKFVYFCRLQLDTGDYDAHIPWMKGLKASKRLSDNDAVLLGFLYMAYYNEASAYVHWHDFGVLYPKEEGVDNLPIETQRRNLYGGRIHDHLSELHQLNEERPWLERLQSCNSWEQLLSTIEQVYGNGRWASYTTSELMLHLADLDLEPDSFEIINSSGPRGGMAALGLEPSEQSCKTVHDALTSEGVTTTYSQLESLLCDWCGVCAKGSFYAGRNIDRQQGRILKVEERLETNLDELWRVRKDVYPERTLGELNGWVGIDKPRLKSYLETRIVLAPWEKR